MSGYPQPPPGYGYGAPPPPKHGHSGPPTSQPYAAQPYAAQPYAAQPYAAQSYPAQPGAPHAAPSAPSYGGPPPPSPGGYPPASGSYGNPFAALMPSSFPPGTDPSIIACFQLADQDGSGLIDDKELQRALSSYNQSFSLRTVHLLMYSFTNTNSRKIGPKEFVQVFHSLQNWRAMFEKVDRDRSGRIDANELREALFSLGFSVSPVILDLLVSKFDKTGGKNRAIEYDNFIECCLTVKGLTEKFKEKDTSYSGSATFTYENFMLAVLPFLVA
ncbi:Calcium-binding EF-hand family protein [Melia azedarach]|uniref:Calcium-binding EF-hand family protein n=2 Tax=Melia azedarach TaxID=155640 RepID=A0ACC1X565_MELAZ|nr:Calcium-binding EF-hand family protein [Melia azedarach]KAJ4706331.1 Calcium-binding EF-hand family protein [Melia azedarach]